MLNDLVDFKKFVAPSLIRIVYWIGIVGIVLMTLGMIAGGGAMMGGMMGAGYGGGGGFSLMGAVFGLIWGVCALIIWRVACEVWIVIFSINDRLGQLVERGKV
jgi:uncharacterized protein DUF4282